MGYIKHRRPVIAPKHEPGYSDQTNYMGQPVPEGYVFVGKKSDLPVPVGNIITLEDHHTYYFTATVDLAGCRLVMGDDTVILGTSSENSAIISTGLSASEALITSIWTATLRNIALTHDIAIDMVATDADRVMDWTAVNFVNCPIIGTMDGYNNLIFNDCAILSSSNWTFDGTISTVAFNNCIFVGTAGQSTIILPATLEITRRFRVIYSAAVAFGGATAFDVSTSATIPVEGYILDVVAFSGGATYTGGVQYSDNKALFVNCNGVINSAQISNYTMTANATVTTISTISTPVKVAGTTVNNSITQKFTNTDNRATYTGEITRDFKITGVLTATSGNNNELGFYIAKNGTAVPESVSYITTNAGGRLENATLQVLGEYTTDDYIEIWVENLTGTTDVTVEGLNVIVEALN